jgi:hypothetical protein
MGLRLDDPVDRKENLSEKRCGAFSDALLFITLFFAGIFLFYFDHFDV